MKIGKPVTSVSIEDEARRVLEMPERLKELHEQDQDPARFEARSASAASQAVAPSVSLTLDLG